MKMEFVFDKTRLAQEGYDEEGFLDTILAFLQERNPKIQQMERGVFEGDDSQASFNAFGLAIRLYKCEWFNKTIKAWYWYTGDEKEDCLLELKKITDRRWNEKSH